MQAEGTFVATLDSIDSDLKGKYGATLSIMAIEKSFFGPLKAKSRGQMISAMTPTQGSAGYVAIEQVEGTLDGKKGSFILQHYGMMEKGEDELTLVVIPDSATHELEGLRGQMQLQTDETGQHSYTFVYEFVSLY